MIDVRSLSKEELLEIVSRRNFDPSEYTILVQKFVTETRIKLDEIGEGSDEKSVNDGARKVNLKGLKVNHLRKLFETWVNTTLGDELVNDWAVKMSAKRFGTAMNAAGIPRKRFNNGYRYICRTPVVA